MPPQLLIVYHSATGGTAQMAQAAWDGARQVADVEVRLLRASEADVQDLLDAQAYLFATPENLAAIAGGMKDFFDRCYYGALERIAGRPYAALVCAGSDGSSAVRQLERIATGWRLRRVAQTRIICTHAQSPAAIQAPKRIGADDLDACLELGTALAQGLSLGVF